MSQAVDMVFEMNANGDFGVDVPNYTDDNVSLKGVKIIHNYTRIVNKTVWGKNHEDNGL